MTDKRIVLTTCGSEEEAERIAQYLVENRLAACVNIIPQVKSIYRWQDKVDSANEHLLLVKTRTDKLAQIQGALRALHSYGLPEFIALPIDDGSTPYLDWIDDNVK